MNISVLGCGRWGTFLAWYANRVQHTVTLWGRPGSKNLMALMAERQNEYLQLPESVRLTDDLEEAVRSAEIILISISAQQLRSFLKTVIKLPNLKDKTFVLCMK